MIVGVLLFFLGLSGIGITTLAVPLLIAILCARSK